MKTSVRLSGEKKANIAVKFVIGIDEIAIAFICCHEIYDWEYNNFGDAHSAIDTAIKKTSKKQLIITLKERLRDYGESFEFYNFQNRDNLSEEDIEYAIQLLLEKFPEFK